MQISRCRNVAGLLLGLIVATLPGVSAAAGVIKMPPITYEAPIPTALARVFLMPAINSAPIAATRAIMMPVIEFAPAVAHVFSMPAIDFAEAGDHVFKMPPIDFAPAAAHAFAMPAIHFATAKH